jgi:hypothetical protein
VVDLGQAGADGRLLASRVEPLRCDLLVYVLPQQPLTLASKQDLEATWIVPSKSSSSGSRRRRCFSQAVEPFMTQPPQA